MTVGIAILAALLLSSVLAPLITPYDPIAQQISIRLQPPSSQHLLGTDQFGRDIFSRVLNGATISLSIAVVVVALAGPFGSIIGLLAGSLGGKLEEVIMRITDIFMSFPTLVLAFLVAAVLGRGIFNTMLAISFVAWPIYTRLARALALEVKHELFIEANRAVGAGSARIVFKDILPLIVPELVIQAMVQMGQIILVSAALGFLGLGVQPPAPEWGVMIANGLEFLHNQWWLSTFPGLFIFISVLAFNLIGDSFRDIMDVRLRGTL